MVLFRPLGWLRRRRGWCGVRLGCLFGFQVGNVFVKQVNKILQLVLESLELGVVGVIADLATNEIQLDLG